jgi:hypothetical protein
VGGRAGVTRREPIQKAGSESADAVGGYLIIGAARRMPTQPGLDLTGVEFAAEEVGLAGLSVSV